MHQKISDFPAFLSFFALGRVSGQLLSGNIEIENRAWHILVRGNDLQALEVIARVVRRAGERLAATIRKPLA